MGHDPPQRRKRTVISFRDVMISGPFSQSEDGELQIEGVLEGDLTCHALIVPPGGTVKGTIRADWVVIQGNFCGNVETSVFTATKDAVVIGGRITVYEKVLIEPECLFRGELQRPGEGDASPARGFARSAAVAESDRLAAETMASWSFTEGDTALVEAIVKGDSKIAGRLLLAGADPNAAAPEGMTALTLAAANLRVEIAELLLGAGADPDLRTAEDETPLLLACDRGAQRLVEVLLAGGADPSPARADGSTPLIEATRRGRTEIVRALLLAGADLEERNAAGEVPMVLAKERGYQETLALLRQAAVGDLEATAEDRQDEPADVIAERDGDAPEPPQGPAAQASLRPDASTAPLEPTPAESEAPSAAETVGTQAEPAEPTAEAVETGSEPSHAEHPPAEAEPEPEDPGPAVAAVPEDPADPIPVPAPVATAPAEAETSAPTQRRRGPTRPKETAESVLADLAPAAPRGPTPALPEAPSPAEIEPGADHTPAPKSEAEQLPEPSPEPEAAFVPQDAPDPEAAEPERPSVAEDEPEPEADPPASAGEPVLDVPRPNGADGEMALDSSESGPDAAETQSPAPPEIGPQREPDDRDQPCSEPYLHIPETATAPAPQPAAETPDPALAETPATEPTVPETAALEAAATEQEAPATEVPTLEGSASEVLAPEEVEDLSRRVAHLIAPFSLDEARAPLPEAAADDQAWQLAAQGEGLVASATRPDPAGREAILVKYGEGGTPPGQIELRVRVVEADGGREAEGELRLSLFDPDDSLVYWPVGFHRVVLHDCEGAGSYTCDEDGNWAWSDDPTGY
ncbi:MAG: ankyrin repeat domain-containing protein [Kiloniellales bacterium]|nr:ankyrin repeat domain-containing protein [Kiloniellales bacterium]